MILVVKWLKAFFYILNRAIFKFAADTRKMMSSYSGLCETSFDAVDAVELEIPESSKF